MGDVAASWAIPESSGTPKEEPARDAATRFDPRIGGALPVITEYPDRLQITDPANDLVPWEGQIPLGTLVEVLLCKRLLNPKALCRVDPGARTAAVTDYLGRQARPRNDERGGRAWERRARHADKVQAARVLTAIRPFRLDVRQVPSAIPGVQLFGAYQLEVPEGETPPPPRPA